MKKDRNRDLFEIIGRIPKGRTYQWVAESVQGNADLARAYDRIRGEGWKPVLTSRHPKMTRRGRRIVVGGQVLMENSTKHATAARVRELKSAREMVSLDAVGKHVGRNYRLDSIDPRWRAQEPITGAFPATDGLPKIIEVALQLKLGHNLVEASAVCRLSIEEYARRMVALILRGDLDGILQPTLERDAWEVRHLTTEKSK